jgi:hypothetical protein
MPTENANLRFHPAGMKTHRLEPMLLCAAKIIAGANLTSRLTMFCLKSISKVIIYL